MARQLNVNLVFNANTTQAKQQMAGLQASMQQIQNSLNQQISMKGLTNELTKAQNAIISLKNNLNSAFDVNTGKLDMNKFNQNMAISQQTVKQYRQALQQIGPEGVRTFNQLSQAILQAQMPMHQTKNLLTSMMDTFGNTIKWSIASSAINKISQGFSEAFQYAQDLNTSLTNIRVVTGLSANEMAKFAEQANKAAKILGTSTTAYTDAALIYYQQGLEGKAVEERAEVTLKLANVTGQTAETVSDQMTAVWNNFYDGSKSLEYYADVLTALGAATASSTDEISDGLEKFAAIAETVGLSYEYATTALATVTAETRQSADVVGTAFKTLFARIQDLELGETLDDGTTLGSYSAALAKVGVNIKDANGNLKDMDIILNEMGAKWQQLNKDQQVALAKSVAGIRQYTQLIALMDNWDTFEVNLTVAEGAEGTLQEQQDIWAESWEAAQKRVQASAEDLYSTLINDKFFIDLNNIFADLLSGLDDFIEAIGGLKTLLPMVAGWMLKAFGPTAVGAVSGFVKSLQGPTAEQQAAAAQTRAEVMRQQTILANNTGGQTGTAMSQTLPKQNEFLKAIEDIGRHLNKQEIERLQLLQQQGAELQNQVLAAAELADKLQAQNEQLRAEETVNKTKANVGMQELETVATTAQQKNALTQAKSIMRNAGEAETEIAKFNSNQFVSENGEFDTAAATAEAQKLAGMTALSDKNMDTNITSPEKLAQFRKGLEGLEVSSTAAAKAQKVLTQQFSGNSEAIDKYVVGMTKANKAGAQRAANNVVISRSEKNVEQQIKNTNKAMDGYIQEAKAMQKVPLAQTLVSIAGSLGSTAAGLSMVVSGVQSATQMFKSGEHTLGGWLGVITSLSFAIPMLAGGLKTLVGSMGLLNTYTAINNTITGVNTALQEKEIALTSTEAAQERGLALAKLFGIETKVTEEGITRLGNMSKSKAIALSIAMKAASILEAVGLGFLIPAKYADAAASAAAGAGTMAMIWPIGLLVLAIAGLVSSIVILIAIFKALSNAYNADAIAAEKARENAKNLTDTYASVKEKYEELKQSLADYQESQNAINKLKEGTIEWKQAIMEANAEVIDLLAKYPELSKYITSQGGRMLIKDEGWNILLKKQNEALTLAQNMSAIGNLNAQKAENQLKQTELVRENMSMLDGSYLNPVEAAASMSFGGVLGYYFAVEKRNQEFINELSEQYSILGEQAFLNLDEKLQRLGITEDEVAESTRKLIREQNRLAEQEKVLIGAAIDNILADRFDFNENTYTQGMQKFVHEKATKDTTEAFKDVDDDNVETNWWGALTSIIGAIFLTTTPANPVLGPLAGALGIGGGVTGLGLTQNDYAMDNGWNVAATKLGKETFEEYMKEQGIEYRDADFKSDGINYKLKNGEDKTLYLSYDTLTEFRKQGFLKEQSDLYVDIVNALNKERSSASRSDQLGDQAYAEFLKSGSLAYMDPELYKKIIEKGGLTEEDFKTVDKEDIERLKDLGIEINNLGDAADYLNQELLKYDYSTLQQNQRQLEEETIQTTFQQGAEFLGIEADALESYADILSSTNKELENNKILAAETAVEHFTLSKSINKLRKAFEDYAEQLNSDNYLEYAEALGAIKAAAEEVLGLELSSNFVEDNIGTMQAMLNGNVEAYETLKEEAIKDWVIGLALSDKDQKAVLDALTKLKNEAENSVAVTLEMDTTEAIDKLNELVRLGSITEQELEAVFRNANLEWAENSTFTYYEIPQTTTTTSYITGSDGHGGNVNLKMETSNTSVTRLPWIGDNPPEFAMVGSEGEAKAFGEKLDMSTISAEGGDQDKIYVDPRDNSEISAQDIASGNKQLEAGVMYQVKGSGKNSEGFKINTSKETQVNSDILTYDKKEETANEKKRRHQDLDEEIDRYRDLNRLSSYLSRELDRISIKKDKAFGKNKIKAIEEEIAAYDSEIAVYDELIARSKEYLSADQKAVEALGGIVDPTTGVVTNYAAIEKTYIDKLKSMSSDDENYQEIYDQYQAFKDAVAQYEDTYDQYQDAITEKTEKELAKIDKILEGVDYVVEIKIEANERQLKYLERLFDRLGDDLYDGTERIANWTKQIGQEFNNIKANTDGLEKTLRAAKVSEADIQAVLSTGDTSILDKYEDQFTDQTWENIKKYVDSIATSQADIEALRKQIQDEVMVTFDAWNEKLENTQNLLSSYGEVLQGYQNIVDIVGPGYLGISTDMLAEMNKASVDIAMEEFKAAQGRLEFQTTAREELQKDLDEALKTVSKKDAEEFQKTGDLDILKKYKEVDKEEVERLQKSIEETDQLIAQAQAEVAASWGDTLTTIYETFGKNVENILNDFEKRMAGIKFNSFESLTDSMEKQKEITDLYVEDYEKIYELSKMNRQLQQKIAQTDSAKGKQVLLEMEEEISKYQTNGVKMSQYELETLQKKYDLKLAEIALEEAQNAKSQVRLSRDSEGNYSYIYTADQDKIDETEQKYEDSLFAMSEHNNSYLQQLEDNLIQVSVRMREEIGGLDISSFGTKKEYEQEVARITGHYTELENEIRRQMELVLLNNNDLYNNDWQAYSEATGYKISNNDLWVNKFSETNLSILTGYKTLEDYEKQFVASTALLLGDLGTTYETWEDQVAKCMEQAGVDTKTLGKGVESFVDDVTKIMTDEQSESFKYAMILAGKSVTDFSEAALGTFSKEGKLYVGLGQFVTDVDDLLNNTTADSSLYKAFDKIATTANGKTVAITSSLQKMRDDANIDLLGKNGLSSILSLTGTNFGKLKTAANTALNSTDGAGKTVNSFSTVVKKAMYGTGTADKPEGGVMGAVDKTIEKFGSLATTGKTKFKKTASSATSFAASFNKVISSSASWVDNLEGSIADLSSKWAETDININVKDTGAKGVVDGVIRELNRLKDQTVNINYGVNGNNVINGGYNNNDYSNNIRQPVSMFGGHGTYVEYEGKYYTKDDASQQDWISFISGQSNDTTGMQSHDAEQIEILQRMYNELIGVSGLEIASPRDGQTFTVFDSYENLRADKGFVYEEGGVHPNITVTDVAYVGDLNGNKASEYYVEGLVTGNARGGLKKNNKYWFPLVKVNKPWSRQYYTPSEFFDTGGYTGEWGPEGRLAMLHQKEIVLNAHDTENLLSIVSMVRDMNDRIELNARAMQYGLTAAYTANNIKSQNDTLQQEVHITAEFPSATNHSEIEEAFRNLTNLASQYANRKF